MAEQGKFNPFCGEYVSVQEGEWRRLLLPTGKLSTPIAWEVSSPLENVGLMRKEFVEMPCCWRPVSFIRDLNNI